MLIFKNDNKKDVDGYIRETADKGRNAWEEYNELSENGNITF